MIVVNRMKDSILVSCRNKDYSVIYSKEKFDELYSISLSSEKVDTVAELTALLNKVELICKNNYKETVESFCSELYVQPITNKFYLKLKDKISDIEIPQQLVRRIKESIDKEIDVTPIIKCWKRFLRNPQANDVDFRERFCAYIDLIYIDPSKVRELLEKENMSEEIANELASTYEVKITKEGLLACFKVSTEIEHKFVADEDGEPKQVNRYTKSFDVNTGEITGDNRDDILAEDRIFLPAMQGYSGDAFYCEGVNGSSTPEHFIRIGHRHRLNDWSQVNCDSTQNCVKGLHLN